MGRRRLREYLGKYVKLLENMQTVSGDTFTCGTVLLCYSHWKGLLNLCRPGNLGQGIRQVDPSRVAIVGQAKGTICRNHFLEEREE